MTTKTKRIPDKIIDCSTCQHTAIINRKPACFRDGGIYPLHQWSLEGVFQGACLKYEPTRRKESE